MEFKETSQLQEKQSEKIEVANSIPSKSFEYIKEFLKLDKNVSWDQQEIFKTAKSINPNFKGEILKRLLKYNFLLDEFNIDGKHTNKIDNIIKFNQKFNAKLKIMLFEVINIKTLSLKGPETHEEKFKKAFDEFWQPISELEKYNKRKEELDNLKQELGQNFIEIQNASNLMKFQKKEKGAEIQKQIISVKKELENIEEKIKFAESIFYLIPNYQKDFEKFKQENYSIEEVGVKKNFRQKWVPENLEKLYKNFSKKISLESKEELSDNKINLSEE